MKIKRIIAYIIDFIIVNVIAAIIFCLPIFKADYNRYSDTYNEYLELFESFATSGSSDIDENALIDIQYNLSKSSTTLFIIRIGVIFMYFGVLSYLLKGQTIAKKLFNLRVVPVNGDTLNPGLYLLRQIILTNFITEVVSLVLIMTCSKNVYFDINTIVSYIPMIVTFLLLGFMIFRDDERGLHDVICGTKVIDCKKSE